MEIPSQRTMPQRFHGLDAVRAAALLLGVLLHTAEGFLPKQIPTALAQRSIDALPFVLGLHYIHIFRMSSFFLIAGFFGCLLWHREGSVGFIRNRLGRILLPLVLGWLLFDPMITCVAIWQARVKAAAMAARAPETSLWHATLSAFTTGEVFRDRFPLEHLWFLYYLLLMYALVLCLRWMCGKWANGARRIADTVFRTVLESWWGTICIAVPLTGAFYHMAPSRGLRTPHGLTPDKTVLLAYFIFFVIGWFLFRQPDLLRILERRALRSSVVGVVAGIWPLALLAHTANTAARLTRMETLSNSAAYALAMVLVTFGFIGIFLRWMSTPRPVVRYLSDSAYWIYLAHYPLVTALLVALAPWPVHWSVKIPIIVMGSLAILLLSYHFLIRYSWIGMLLSGPRRASATHIAEIYANPSRPSCASLT
jgi:glucan biosynthesis protein C